MPNNKLINLEWKFYKDESEARKAITDLENDDDTKGDESADLIDDFNADFVPFEKDTDLKWDANQPLMIKWEVRLDATKDIEDVVIDKTQSVMKNWREAQETAWDDKVNYDYTMEEEIVNELREVLIDEYQKEIPVEFNEIFTVFTDDESTFGFDVYQLNASNTKGEVHIIDAASAVKNGVFDKIKNGLLNRVEIKIVE